jgi:hypothetical protein
MAPAKILIQFPTRQRPGKFLRVAKLYIDLMNDKDNWIMNVSCDDNDPTMNNPVMMRKIYKLHPDKVFLNFNPNKSKIQAVNADVSEYDFDIVLLASDDMIPRERGYDNVIRKFFSLYFSDYDGVLHFDDGFQHDRLNTLSIVGKKYYDRFGYLYHPSYISLSADTEFDDVSRILGKRKYIEQVIIKHEHPETGAPMDELYRKNNAFANADRRNYLQRKAMNFKLK